MDQVIRNKKQNSRAILWLLAAGFLLRLFLGGIYRGHNIDMNCFMGWADRLFSQGIPAFYKGDGFSDYPPGYMYVLWVLGALRSRFGLDNYAPISILLTKLPAMICDLASGYVVYLLAKERLSQRHGLICAAIYVFSPTVLFNSSVWGQVDSITALLMLLVCYNIYKEKMPLAYVCFAIGLLMKPQMAFIFPVLLVGIIDRVFLNGFRLKNFLINLFSGIASICGMILLAIPFGLKEVIAQYGDTVSSYPKATVNAYNFWAMLGMNWHEQTEKVLGLSCAAWGTIFIVLIFAAALIMWFRSKKDRSKYFFLSAFIIVGIFTLSVRMHERYMFYALLLLLGLYAVRPRKEFFIAYVGLSLVQLLNMWDVLFHYDASNFDWKDPYSRFIGFLTVAGFLGICFLGWNYYRRETADEMTEDGASQMARQIRGVFEKSAKDAEQSIIRPSQKPAKITRWDILAMILISGVFCLITFHDLGDRQAPVTGWETHTVNDTLVFHFDKGVTITEIHYYLGNYSDRKFNVDASDSPLGPWISLKENTEFSSVFKWQKVSLNQQINQSFVRFTSLSNEAAIWELVFLDGQGQPVLPMNADEYPQLFDEQDLFTGRATSMNSSYFDEVYHARTAYEYMHGLYSYENTHPPLGKILISLGMRIFGVNPFGWRFMGALFGVLMLPFIYLFAKRMFRESWISIVVTLLFAFDFMHFVQTRIATIDVFVTFFVILMYYFMYRYSTMSFYDTPLEKTYRPLALCGISMGLGVACKWTGVYAAAGLAVVFFVILYRRYREYVYAKTHPEEFTGNIAHKDVIRKFPVYTKNTILFCCLVFIVIPVCIYTLSYIPFRDNTGAGLFARMARNQQTMFNYHSKLVSQHDYASRWYEWPILKRPVWYYSGHPSALVSEGISAFGNPLVWWAGIPAFFMVLYLAIARKDRKAGFLTVGYLAQYMPWMLVSRTTYMYHYFPSVPFVTLMLGYVCLQFAGKSKGRRAAVFGYVAAAIGLFVLFYPVLSGHPVEKTFVDHWLRWFDTWTLVT